MWDVIVERHTNKTFPVFGKGDVARCYPISYSPFKLVVLRARIFPTGGHCTLVVYHYVHLIPFHNTNTGVRRPKIYANDRFSRFDGGGLDGWEDGERADEDEEKEENADP